ncbi:MAG: hypothetical protein IJ774_00970 [Selenomonadaceae bacterium]|nr:hypothetical protein [Selenomonadaceae bacterium]
MGEYREDWFSFYVKSLRHILDLSISPAFAKGVGFQVHETEPNSFRLFWNYELRPVSEQWNLIKRYVELNKDKIDLKMPLSEFYFSAELADFMRKNAPPIQSVDLNADDMNLVNAVVNANWRDEKYRCGLDGHHYDIKIYGAQVRKFKCWREIPNAWQELIPLVERLIDIAKLKPRDCYEVHGVWGADGVSRRLKPLPPPSTAGMIIEIPDWLKRP